MLRGKNEIQRRCTRCRLHELWYDLYYLAWRKTVALKNVDEAASLLLAAELCRGANAVIDLTVEYLKTRKQFT